MEPVGVYQELRNHTECFVSFKYLATHEEVHHIFHKEHPMPDNCRLCEE